MKAKTLLLLCYLALMAFSQAVAQVANFTIDSPTGCSPLSVNFTNTSTGAGTLTYSWDLGNGNTSTLKDPKAVYSTAGNYVVKLTVSNGTTNNSIQKSIVVYKNPSANFTANTKGCIPINISFTDASTKGDANITKWNWDFRNGVLSSAQNPVNSYSQAGKFDVFLEVIDANSCKSTIEKKSFIDVADKPVVSFYATPANACTIPASIQFTNQSTGGGTLTYAWDFGDGITSTSTNPKITYSKFGTFNVKLVVKSDYGCSSTLDAPSVVIGEVTAAGSLKQGSKTITNNSIVCAGDIDFTNLSAGNANCYWDFGDGSSSYSASGKHAYADPGNYKVKLIAAPGSSCADTTSWNFTIEKAVAGFNISPAKSCNPSTVVSFVNQSSDNIILYKWTFDDGTSSTDKNAIKTYTEPKDKDQYVVHHAKSYPVKLVVSSTNGCKDSIDKVFTVQQPTALFSLSAVEGCAPLTVLFNDQSLSEDPLKERIWKFGEGADYSVISTSASHTYTAPGTYNVKLIAKTETGCKDTSYTFTIKVGTTLTPDFSIGNSIICPSQPIEFSNQSPAGISRWHYSIAGKGVAVCPENPSPTFYMKTDTGKFSVKLKVDYNGCISEAIKTDALKNDGPVGSFTYRTTCNTTRAVAFQGNAKKATSFKWDFGDSQTNTSNLQLTHFYSTEGNYTVKFITVNGSCSDTVIRIVKVRDHQPSFTLKAETCAENAVFFNSKLSHTLYDSKTEKYLWDFGDSSQMIRTHRDSVSHSFMKGGTFKVKLFAFYDDGCIDSVNHSIRVYQPVPNFTVDKSKGCAPLTVAFTDNSTPDVHPINFWSWDFQDGNTLSYTSKVNTLDNTFGYPGEYDSKLTVSDDFGCTASYEKKISTAIPTASFSAISPTQICSGTDVNFLIDYPDPDSAVWSFGNGQVLRSIAKPTKFQYADTGNFTVSLTLYKYGCSDIFAYNNYIQVQKANAKFTASDTAYNCYPRKIKLTHTAGKNNILTGRWYYGQGNNSSPGYTDTTSYIYTEPGVYRPKLELQTSFGCTDTFSRILKITGPVGQFSVTPEEACKGTDINYVLSDTANVYSFEWDLGDGNFSKNNPVTHKYISVGNKTAKLILYGDKGKCIPPAIEKTIHIYEVKAGISVADTSICEGTTVEFVNTSTGATSFNWNFGDGTNSTAQLPNHLFTPGTYKVSLTTVGEYGCKDTTFQYIVVSKMPKLTVGNDTMICLGGTALLTSTGDEEIRWEPVSGLSSSTIPNPVATPEQTVNYIAFATNPVSQCYKKDSILVTVQQIPNVQVDVEATSIIAGRPVQIMANTEEGALFEWTPADFLSCTTCFNPISTARANTSYVLKVTDKNKCFTVEKTVTLKVEEGTKAFDIPSAFTPSGTEPNNIFKVQGYNVKQLIEFKIYNRWGNLVFSSTDLSKGWDGTYQGKVQPVDSYVYTIKIETFDGNIESKKGTILLIR